MCYPTLQNNQESDQKVRKAGGSTTMRESTPQGSVEPPKLPFVGNLRPTNG